ncbi:hypothetical protein GCM10027605_16940 [Micromonospora zhanjiangensis]
MLTDARRRRDVAPAAGGRRAGELRRINGRETRELFVTLGQQAAVTPQDQVVIELVFTDHAGHRWRRVGVGQPEPSA